MSGLQKAGLEAGHMAAKPAAAIRRSARSRSSSTLISVGLLAEWPLPEPHGGAGKEGRGTVMVIGGSKEVPGAVILAATAALRAGAGRLQIATAREVAPWVAVTVPEARVIGLRESGAGRGFHAGVSQTLRAELERCDAVLLGPGMRPCAAVDGLLRTFAAGLSRREGARVGAMILDAGALERLGGAGALARLAGIPAVPKLPVIATPHMGEMATMLRTTRDRVSADPLAIAIASARRFGVIVVLKGERTYIAAPDGTAFHNTCGNSGLGTSGSGDVLSGIIAGLCARGAEPLQAAVWGVFLHARAGELLAEKMGTLGFLARELLPEIPGLMARLGSPRRHRRSR
jgi:ADP-dependent NAD(P)H-hydrate dehydratase